MYSLVWVWYDVKYSLVVSIEITVVAEQYSYMRTMIEQFGDDIDAGESTEEK